MKYQVLCALVFVLTGCSPSLDPAIRDAVNALDEAYVMDVKPADASFTNCSYAQVETRHVMRCGISYGSTQLANVGYWEIEQQGSAFSVYAMNGKALAALDKITLAGTHSSTNYPGKFKGGQGRSPLDMAKVNATEF
ncbi:hypothetical protein [Comamonas thiooxydans]|uniref:hypothetical protein n=1 Tax=Comamonas thiooxydans TaxID=363952 RepID=UPI002114E782|nr:hypothetical protein [Comamonas thiooxydans]UUE94849.1 hypothetical protein MJ608_04100 [Comamonas thiooxydans]